MKALSKIFTILFYIELVILVVLSLLCFAGKPFGFNNYAVVSASMTPTIQVGSMVYVNTNVSASQIQKGDIVAFYTDEDRTKPSIHRTLSNEKTSKTITTKGDANEAQDIAPIPYSDVIGKADTTIPYLGYICDFVASHGIAIALVVLGTALLSLSISRLDRYAAVSIPRGSRRNYPYEVFASEIQNLPVSTYCSQTHATETFSAPLNGFQFNNAPLTVAPLNCSVPLKSISLGENRSYYIDRF